jgi:ADP-heptose:LPS heptosyltransferase
MIQKISFKLALLLFTILGFFNFKKNDVVVICCPLFIGDMIFLFPLIRALKKNKPYRKIIFLCREEFTSLLKLNSDIDQVCVLNKSAINVLKIYRIIVNADYFYTPMADYWRRLALATHAKNIISFDGKKNINALRFSGVNKPQHVSEYLLELLPVNEVAEINVEPFLLESASYPNLLVIQCDGRNLNTKSFTDAQLEQIFEIVKSFPVKIQLMGLYKPLNELNLHNVLDLRGKSSFDEWLNYILGARFVIGLDSAAAQLRKAVGKSAFILMGPADDLFFGNTPLFPNITITSRSDLSCRDRKVFQGQFFESLNNCQKNICNNPIGKICIDGEIFTTFLDSIRDNLELIFKV